MASPRFWAPLLCPRSASCAQRPIATARLAPCGCPRTPNIGSPLLLPRLQRAPRDVLPFAASHPRGQTIGRCRAAESLAAHPRSAVPDRAPPAQPLGPRRRPADVLSVLRALQFLPRSIRRRRGPGAAPLRDDRLGHPGLDDSRSRRASDLHRADRRHYLRRLPTASTPTARRRLGLRPHPPLGRFQT